MHYKILAALIIGFLSACGGAIAIEAHGGSVCGFVNACGNSDPELGREIAAKFKGHYAGATDNSQAMLDEIDKLIARDKILTEYMKGVKNAVTQAGPPPENDVEKFKREQAKVQAILDNYRRYIDPEFNSN
jgi:hypothetical protein